MKLAAIFQDLEHLNYFQTIGCGSHFVFQNKAKILHRHVFIVINIPCKLSEDSCINIQKAFYYLSCGREIKIPEVLQFIYFLWFYKLDPDSRV